MTLIELPNPIIRHKSTKVRLPLQGQDLEIATAMMNYISESQQENTSLRPGIGIAAVQLGYPKRMFYIDATDENNERFTEFLINPVITSRVGRAALEKGEGCLSVNPQDPGQEGLVHRAHEITIKGYSWLSKQEVSYVLRGFLAIVAQHEYDHLNGKLFIDHIDHAAPFRPRADEILI